MKTQSITIDMNKMTGTEAPLRSVRRTSIELHLIRRMAQILYDQEEIKVWRSGDGVLIVFETNFSSVTLIKLDEDGEPDCHHVMILVEDLILRTTPMGESSIYNMIKYVADNPYWIPCKDVQVEFIRRTSGEDQ